MVTWEEDELAQRVPLTPQAPTLTGPERCRGPRSASSVYQLLYLSVCAVLPGHHSPLDILHSCPRKVDPLYAGKKRVRKAL